MFKNLRRKPKPKKLTLRQVHELYLLLKHALPEKDKELLIDEIDDMMGRMGEEDVFVGSIEIMYDKAEGNPIEMLLLFTKGLVANNFFEYVAFVRNLKSNHV